MDISADTKITEWLLEYCYNKNRRLYQEKNVTSEDNRDFIQGVFDLYSAQGPQSSKNDITKHCIWLVCYLIDGEDFEAKYEWYQDETTLERALRVMIILQSCLEELDLREYCQQILQQAVFVCARDSDFERADVVFERIVMNQDGDVDHAIQQRITEVLRASDPAHPTLSRFSYSKFTTNMLCALDKIEQLVGIKQPFLVQIANEEIEKMKNEENCWKKLDINFTGNQVSTLMGSLGVETPRLSHKKSKQWKEVQSLLQDRKDEILPRLDKYLETDSQSDLESNDNHRRRKNGVRKRHMSTSSSSVHEVEEDSDDSVDTIQRLRKRMPVHQMRESLAPTVSRYSTRNKSPLSPRSPAKLRRPWDDYELEQLWKGVQTCGIGKWSVIRSEMNLPRRSGTQIKDKWRNIINDPKLYKQLERKFDVILSV